MLDVGLLCLKQELLLMHDLPREFLGRSHVWGPVQIFPGGQGCMGTFQLFFDHNYITFLLAQMSNCRLTFTRKEFSVLIIFN